MKNITVDDAINRVRARALAPVVETVVLAKGPGRVLASDVAATRDQPPFNASAMDGYAVRRDSLLPKAKTLTLHVVGESSAGRAYPGGVAVGEAVRIFTGAPMPAGCDAIIIQEHVTRRDGVIDIGPEGRHPLQGHIRRAGQDFRAGDILLEAGVRLDPWWLSLAAAAGRDRLDVHRRPKIVVLCTGDELVLPGEKPKADQIYESASHALIALIKQWGGKARYLGVRADDAKAIQKALKGADADLIVTVGGASVGDYDLVKPALQKLGLSLDFESVAVRPGKPTSFGVLTNGIRVLGLPGNPASAFVTAQLFLKPWIESSLGMTQAPAFITAISQTPLPAAGPREAYLRAHLSCSQQGQLQVTAFDDQDSSLVSVFARADVLIRLPANAPSQKAGARVDVLPLDRL
ncbi:gephyrin-like molybdotransferase Glp [Asticcacaulis sp. 201]|uniref:molybdopterin molybdotransferase MoeA n=1 Tax=Asticcacaulis sp. 201 TaxID=3028787 RepID=UPI002916BAFC|nr:gephyrin-like molybdotransferase Glp [Asticcacaulis sp. 201]MDV6331719.1 molybdopterin molybdotransferase MoeA [Asticcacaulis sp. 201]